MTTGVSKIEKALWVVGAAIVAIGFLPVPLTDPALPKATWLEWSIAALPVVPLVILTVSLLTVFTLPVVFGLTLAIAFLAAGMFVTFLMMALSGGGTEMVMVHGTALTLAVTSSILLASKVVGTARSVLSGVFIVPVLLALWSLAVVPLASSNASKIASEQAFCIGEHSPKGRELSSKFGLRGLSFYTTRSGYKIGDQWYFHGVLLVENRGERIAYNWSPRKMTFQLVEHPHRFIASPLNTCEPRKRFLEELSWL